MARQRVSVVTLGVGELERARRFYGAWGWVEREGSDEVVFFQLNGLVLALFPTAALADDQGRPVSELGTGAVALAQNFHTDAEVDERFHAALSAGARMLKRPAKALWGGYSGYVADPDGHVWELAVNPFWDLEDDGSVTIPDDSPAA
ncbi:VOC family protein [Demequina sp. SO4-18]|uniref:VOC family protein n=1 Tax=Demequina sp. SO4-18 TaxID=3401026 RepID=UPI003B5B748F